MMGVGNNQEGGGSDFVVAAEDETAPDDPWKIESVLAGLINSPIDFIFAEHQRQRQAAIILNFIADGEFDREGVANLVDFLDKDFALHVGDEELGFFPILKQQCAPEDNIDALIERLADEHRADEEIVDDVLVLLKNLVRGDSPTRNNQRLLRTFSEHIRQHLAFENAVLLPIARVRMDDRALKALSEILKGRRERRSN